MKGIGEFCCGLLDNHVRFVVVGCRVYERDKFRLVQTNVGHEDAVKQIIHVPERNQVTGSTRDLYSLIIISMVT